MKTWVLTSVALQIIDGTDHRRLYFKSQAKSMDDSRKPASLKSNHVASEALEAPEAKAQARISHRLSQQGGAVGSHREMRARG
jgi:hypothetical protein